MNWVDGPLLAIDFETTGVDVYEDRAVTCAVVQISEDRQVAMEQHVFLTGVEIPEGATAIHGWTNDMVEAEGVEPELILPVIGRALMDAMALGKPIVAYNARFDLTLFNVESERYGMEPLEFERVIDPFIIDKYLDRFRRGKRTLISLCEHYNVLLDGAHDAGFDAIAAARLAWRMGTSIPALGSMDLDDLHEAQIGWAYDQAASFKAYLVSEFGKTDKKIAGAWPTFPEDDDVPLDPGRQPLRWSSNPYG